MQENDAHDNGYIVNFEFSGPFQKRFIRRTKKKLLFVSLFYIAIFNFCLKCLDDWIRHTQLFRYHKTIEYRKIRKYEYFCS